MLILHGQNVLTYNRNDTQKPGSKSPPFTFTGKNNQIWFVKLQAFMEAYELSEAVIEDKPLAALQKNPTLAKIKSNIEEKVKKYKSKSLM